MDTYRTRTVALAALVVGGMLLAACAGAGDRSTTGQGEGIDRGAQEEQVADDWDAEFDITLNNWTTKSIEVAVIVDPNQRADGKQLISISPPPSTDGSPTAAAQWQAAGRSRLIVVPPAPAGGATASQVDVHVQQKLNSTPSQTDRASKPDADGSQNVLLVLPTAQLRFRLDYDWQRADDCTHGNSYGPTGCDYHRTRTMNVQTRDATGWMADYQTVQQCLDPMRLTNFEQEIGDATQPWNARPMDTFNTVTVDFRAPSTIATSPCPAAEFPNLRLPGMSLAPDSQPAAHERVNLSGKRFPDAQMPGVDLSYAKLAGVDLSSARRANLAYARLAHTDLTDATFSDAILAGADFTGATVTNASFRNAVLYDVDLSTTTGTLPWQNLAGAHLCRTKLPESTIEDYKATTKRTDPPDVDGSCDEKITGMMGSAPGNVALVDTNSSVPLTLAAQSGSFDCAMASVAGAFSTLAWPAPACWGIYGSSRLIEKGIPDDDVPRTTTTLKGQTPPHNALHNGSIDLGGTGASLPTDGLSLSSGTLPEGWTQIVCLFVQRDPETNSCQDLHRPLQPTA